MYITWLDDNSYDFPSTEEALDDPNGLLAAGGDLAPKRLLNAYSQGIFPWFSEDEPIMWWSPSPRCVLLPEQFYASKSLKKLFRQSKYSIRSNTCFDAVIEECSKERKDQNGTWITDDMKEAYNVLHHLGYAHSIEVFNNQVLVGGLYGVAIGGIFFGESMFSKKSNTSKLALYALSEFMKNQNLLLIDCQVTSSHLVSLGAIEIQRAEFEKHLSNNLDRFGMSTMKVDLTLL
ncbi:leucyl/phenylalanyl-tRNA--protein transferase [Litoribrevibacter albus]|uniref:Leucyl/phenylalanyl-tRNA--protein transferase n=1 Tax=Litoribrevibacter albus TaxID=1473156 RepID=A0AA37SB41_9GAMM|nr:leucyl/phenylalanyl-tRNA--protein transferase [Litoribrevibacter albus]GLQ31703.1 leucyl/phenylalanyl-tRNA--protein transferase [Litoribrevibacter albus]